MCPSTRFVVVALIALGLAGLFAGRAGGHPPRIVFPPAYVTAYRPAYVAYAVPVPPPGVIVSPRPALYRPVYVVRSTPSYAVYYTPGAIGYRYGPVLVTPYQPPLVYAP